MCWPTPCDAVDRRAGSSLEPISGIGLPTIGVTGGTGYIIDGPPTGGTDRESDIPGRLARMA